MLRKTRYILAAFLLAMSSVACAITTRVSAATVPIYYTSIDSTTSNLTKGHVNPDGTGNLFLGSGRSPQPSPDGSKIAYIDSGPHTLDLFVANADGSNATNLTNEPSQMTGVFFIPSWSPDGTKLVFSEFTQGYPGGGQPAPANMYTINPDGTGKTQLTNSNTFKEPIPAAWSPDGSKIIYSDSGDDPNGTPTTNGLHVMNSDGSDQHLVIPRATGSWSPDGSKLLLEVYDPNGQELAISNADGSNLTFLSVNPEDGTQLPAWSPDGRWISFISQCLHVDCRNKPAPSRLTIMRPDGSDRRDITPLSNGSSVQPQWSPDSLTIAFVKQPSGSTNSAIYTIPMVGGTPTPVLNDPTTPVIGIQWGYAPRYQASDATPPTLGTPTWSLNPKPTDQSSTLTVSATDDSAGVFAGEYYMGDTDPGQGHAQPMTWDGTSLRAVFNNNMDPGTYIIHFRAEDKAANWSDTKTTTLVVIEPVPPFTISGNGQFTPKQSNGDKLPGLISPFQTNTATYSLSVGYHNGTVDQSSFQLSYHTGFLCGLLPLFNCHTFTVDNAAITQVSVDQTNNSHALMSGTATVKADATTTTNPIILEVNDGSLMNPEQLDHITLKVYGVGANPATAPVLYQASGSISASTGIQILPQ